MNKVFYIGFFVFSFSILYCQDWKKALESKGKQIIKKVEQEIKKEVKPLTVDFKVSDIKYRPFKSVNKLTLTIDFSGNNPNSMGITFDRTEFQLLVNDRLLSTFYNEKKIKIPKNGDYFFQETAEVNILEAGRVVFNSILKRKAVYTLIGKYFLETPFGPFSFDIKLLEKEVNGDSDKKSKKDSK